ncbi:unnamed protein product [Rhizophagus irregularis]|nr:unnamed protein product [Rhizophagus irregularis]
MIITDSGANMKKAIKDMGLIAKNIKWQLCVAHTLQLIIEKGLNIIKLLVLRAKRIIDFFLRPKQSERLEEIQKKSQFQVDLDAATRYLGGEKYITHSIMHPIINEIKKLLLPTSSTSLTPTSTLTSSIPISIPTLPLPNNDILLEIENANDVFVVIEEVEILETEETNNPRIKYMGVRSNEEEILREKYEEYKEDFLPTPIASRPTSPTLSETTFSTIIYKPTLFAIFEQDQPRVADEVTEPPL